MKITHVLTGRSTGHVLAEESCPCCPGLTVTARPGEQVTVLVSHRSLPKESR